MNILIVESNSIDGILNSYYAEQLSFVNTIQVVKSLESAREKLEKESFDLLLLGMNFPSGHGLDFMHWIRNITQSPDIIVISADSCLETVEGAFQMGAADYLVKPYIFQRFQFSLSTVHARLVSRKNITILDQATLDNLFGKQDLPKSSPFSGNLDKGLSSVTYNRVIKEVMKSKNAFTAGHLGDQLGIARVTIRRYLDFMNKQGLLKVEPVYGKVGRPRHYYRLR